MRIVLLGTTGYHPNDRRHTACLMLPEVGLVFDAGTAFYRARDQIQTPELDICLSHVHLDHVVGLTFLIDVVRDLSLRRVTVHGEPDKLAAIQEHLLNELLFPVGLPCEYRPLAPAIDLPHQGRLTHFPLVHPGGSVGFRVDFPGHSLAYVTDTTATPDAPYIEHIRGVDLLIHECYFPDAYRELAVLTGHSHTTPVAQVAAAAGVKRLVLVHINPLSEADDPIGLDVARAIFPRTDLSFDGQILDF